MADRGESGGRVLGPGYLRRVLDRIALGRFGGHRTLSFDCACALSRGGFAGRTGAAPRTRIPDASDPRTRQ
nr:hypothetical protein StreXyl84_48230 [Streptomyces sp. Xyl84]